MKEIDFLPVWYKNSRRRTLSYRWQYAIIGTIFAGMVCWSFSAGKIISSSSADISQNGLDDEFKELKSQFDDLSVKQNLIDRCSSNIKMSAILAELSFVTNKEIVLNKLQLISQEYKQSVKSNTPRAAVVHRAGGQESFLDKNIIFKLVISGTAENSENVAELICNIEKSDYFINVIPAYTKSVKKEERTITEFEIECYIANYKADSQTVLK